MKVLLLNTPFIFSVIPRKYPNFGDNLILGLRDETSEIINNPVITWNTDNQLNITIDPSVVFITQTKYEVILINNGELIYQGKMIILDQNTDVQNYTYGSQTTSQFSYE